ncbi:MAG TPA: extracellular solute-binding protein [Candidatus Acidoferrales bacterium]|nr:extracellular solute-binding protein [Candidatus Acidoferrales bacterium]
MKVVLITLWLFAATATSLPAQAGKPASAADLARYTGADREQVLFAGAKKEGKVVWYTSLISYKEIAQAFEAKYPGVKVEAYRGNSSEITSRVINEAKARRHAVDAIETTPPALMLFREEKLLMPFTTPNIAAYPDDAKEDAPGKLYYWVSDRESYVGVGYNKNAIPPKDVPKQFADLTNPALKGKLAISGSETGERIIGAMVKAKGEEFVRKLKEQGIKLHMISGGALNELIVSGEVAISPSIFRNHVLQAQEKGSPVDWVPMELVVANAGGVALAAHAQRPHAALLFNDFLLSPEGQKMMEEKFKFGTALKSYGFTRWYPEKGLTLQQYEAANNRWNRLMMEISRK